MITQKLHFARWNLMGEQTAVTWKNKNWIKPSFKVAVRFVVPGIVNVNLFSRFDTYNEMSLCTISHLALDLLS